MHQTILMHADIHKGTELGHIGHQSGEFHTQSQVFGFFNPLSKGKGLKLFSRITSGATELIHDVLQGRQTHFLTDILLNPNTRTNRRTLHEIG